MALAVFISYGLQCYVPITVIWRDYMLGRLLARNVDAKHQNYWNYGLRVVLVLITCECFYFWFLVPDPKVGDSKPGVGICTEQKFRGCVIYNELR